MRDNLYTFAQGASFLPTAGYLIRFDMPEDAVQSGEPLIFEWNNASGPSGGGNYQINLYLRYKSASFAQLKHQMRIYDRSGKGSFVARMAYLPDEPEPFDQVEIRLYSPFSFFTPVNINYFSVQRGFDEIRGASGTYPTAISTGNQRRAVAPPLIIPA